MRIVIAAQVEAITHCMQSYLPFTDGRRFVVAIGAVSCSSIVFVLLSRFDINTLVWLGDRQRSGLWQSSWLPLALECSSHDVSLRAYL